MRGDIFFSILVQAWRTCVARAAGSSCKADYMHVDQVLGSDLGERQVAEMIRDQLANSDRGSDCVGQGGVFALLAAERGVVFFQLHVGRALAGELNFYAAFDDLGA